jgi:hypothetical protein
MRDTLTLSQIRSAPGTSETLKRQDCGTLDININISMISKYSVSCDTAHTEVVQMFLNGGCGQL